MCGVALSGEEGGDEDGEGGWRLCSERSRNNADAIDLHAWSLGSV